MPGDKEKIPPPEGTPGQGTTGAQGTTGGPGAPGAQGIQKTGGGTRPKDTKAAPPPPLNVPPPQILQLTPELFQ